MSGNYLIIQITKTNVLISVLHIGNIESPEIIILIHTYMFVIYVLIGIPSLSIQPHTYFMVSITFRMTNYQSVRTEFVVNI